MRNSLYEELIGIFLGEKMPGVGIYIGLIRLISRLLKAGILDTLPATPAQMNLIELPKKWANREL